MVVLLSLCTVYLSFCASAITMCTSRCPEVLAGLATLASAKQARADLHATAFHKDETTTHFPHDIQQSMRCSYIQSWKPVVTGCSNG